MTHMNALIPLSAQRAAWLLAGRGSRLAPAAMGPVSAGEAERLELVDAIAVHMETLTRFRSADAPELAACRRLLDHLRGPVGTDTPDLCLQ
jgi:hypothetical protein